MTRREERENTFMIAFEESFNVNTFTEILEHVKTSPEYSVSEYGETLIRAYILNRDEIDQMIQANLKGWSSERIPRICLIILRIAIVEMFFMQDVPDSVAINEAVELVKKYADESDYQFVNGVLGSIAKQKEEKA